jgi:hypothetical protein
MKNPVLAFASCLRHAFMSGAGYEPYAPISDLDQARWAEYDPPEKGAFATMSDLIGGNRIEIIEEVVSAPMTMSDLLVPAKDLEYMRKNILACIPVGSVWLHNGNKAHYRVEGRQSCQGVHRKVHYGERR